MRDSDNTWSGINGIEGLILGTLIEFAKEVKEDPEEVMKEYKTGQHISLSYSPDNTEVLRSDGSNITVNTIFTHAWENVQVIEPTPVAGEIQRKFNFPFIFVSNTDKFYTSTTGEKIYTADVAAVKFKQALELLDIHSERNIFQRMQELDADVNLGLGSVLDYDRRLTAHISSLDLFEAFFGKERKRPHNSDANPASANVVAQAAPYLFNSERYDGWLKVKNEGVYDKLTAYRKQSPIDAIKGFVQHEVQRLENEKAFYTVGMEYKKRVLEAVLAGLNPQSAVDLDTYMDTPVQVAVPRFLFWTPPRSFTLREAFHHHRLFGQDRTQTEEGVPFSNGSRRTFAPRQ